MPHKIKFLPKSEIELEVVIPAEEMEVFWRLANKNITEKIQVKGFRPGKMPENLLKDQKIQEEIYNEAASLAVKKTYPDVLAEEGLEPLGNVQIEILKIAPKNEFVYRLKTAILPKFKLPDYKEIAKKISKERKKTEVQNSEIEKVVQWLQKSRAEITPIERPAQKGDLVELEINSFIEGQELKKASGKENFILGEGRFLPGFEEKIEGLKAGEKKNFTLKAPADYWDETLWNKNLSFEVKMNKVSERRLMEISDEWAKSIGNFNNLEELKNSIKEGILWEKEMKERDRLRILMTERLLQETEIDLTEVLIENEVNHRLEEVRHLAQDSGMSFEEYLKKIKKDEEILRRDLKEEAAKTLKIALILREIGKLEKCEPKPEEIEKTMNEFLKSYSGKEAEERIDRKNLFEYTKERLTNEKVFQFLESLG